MNRTTPSSKTSYSRDRKSTRLNSSHLVTSYAVFCLKKTTLFRSRMHKANELLDTGCCLLFADCAGLTEQLLDVGDDARAFFFIVGESRGHFPLSLSHALPI